MSVAIIVIFLVLMFLGVPIAVSLGAASVIVMIFASDLPLNMAAQSMFTAMNSFIMVAVPLFILCGSLMDEGGIADRIYDLAEALVGWIYGGLGHVSVVVNMLFAGMSGSSVAAIASIGKMSINALEKKGYPKDYATAINLSGSMLASVIPPSILMINAAATANVSIGQALLAGLIPGIIIGIIFMIYNYIYCKRHKIGDRTPFVAKKLGKAESRFALTPREVAEAGFRGMQSGELIIIPNWKFHLLKDVICHLPVRCRIAFIRAWQEHLLANGPDDIFRN